MKKYLFFLSILAIVLISGFAFAQENRSWPCPRRFWSNGQQAKMVVIKGTITNFSFPVGVLKTQQEEVYVRLGPWWFWKQKGYSLKIGDSVSAQGYKYGNYFVPVNIKTSSKEIVLRDKQGFPLWRRCWQNCGRGRHHLP